MPDPNPVPVPSRSSHIDSAGERVVWTMDRDTATHLAALLAELGYTGWAREAEQLGYAVARAAPLQPGDWVQFDAVPRRRNGVVERQGPDGRWWVRWDDASHAAPYSRGWLRRIFAHEEDDGSGGVDDG